MPNQKVERYEPLRGGDYKNASYMAALQRTLNYYIEALPSNSDEPYPFIHQPTPGLTSLHPAPPSLTGCRGLYRDTQTLQLWGVWDQNLYVINSSFQFTLVGVLQPGIVSNVAPRATRVSMTNNEQFLIITDNSGDGQLNIIGDGWICELLTHSFSKINEGTNLGWLGSPMLDYMDTFIFASEPNTPNWYVSDSVTPTWSNADFFASKTSVADNIVGIGTTTRYVWLFGKLSNEVWTASNNITTVNNFPYAPLPNANYAIGCLALWSIAKSNDEIFFLGRNESGHGVIYQTESIGLKRISTHAIENEIQQYPKLTDAEGFCYQQNGHDFYVITFPSANDDRGATWVYDGGEAAWHERAWIDKDGIEWRHRARIAVDAYDKIVCGDWFTNDLYCFDLTNPTDNGQTIIRERTGPHIVDISANKRIRYTKLNVAIQPGLPTNQVNQPAIKLVECSFDATDGTLLQNYSNVNDIGSDFTKLNGSTNEEIISQEATGVGSGNAVYQPSGQPMSTQTDYYLQFNVNRSANTNSLVSGNNVFAIGRADPNNNGYKASVVAINSSNLAANLAIMGTTQTFSVPMGPILLNGNYQVTLDMESTAINMSIYRSDTGTWLLPTATWSPSKAYAISITDSTFEQSGNILIGGVW